MSYCMQSGGTDECRRQGRNILSFPACPQGQEQLRMTKHKQACQLPTGMGVLCLFIHWGTIYRAGLIFIEQPPCCRDCNGPSRSLVGMNAPLLVGVPLVGSFQLSTPLRNALNKENYLAS